VHTSEIEYSKSKVGYMKRIDECFVEQLARLNILISKDQLNMFQTYYDMLIESNKVMNLTAITDLYEVYKKHFVDSVAIHKVFPLDSVKTLIDVGTGAGFPGVPIKILFPHIKVTLVDSLDKRVRFLRDLIQELNLDHVEAVHSRAEDLAKDNLYREQYDLSISRAVSNLSTLAEYTLPFVQKGGNFISYKGNEVEEEVETAKRAIQILGGSVTSIQQIKLPDSDIMRSYVIINKIDETPSKYPRKAGKPEKTPIK